MTSERLTNALNIINLKLKKKEEEKITTDEHDMTANEKKIWMHGLCVIKKDTLIDF